MKEKPLQISFVTHLTLFLTSSRVPCSTIPRPGLNVTNASVRKSMGNEIQSTPNCLKGQKATRMCYLRGACFSTASFLQAQI